MTEPFSTQQISVERAAPGTVVGGRYVLKAAVGTGGMGTVWRATDTQLNRDVAVKEVVPPPGIAPEDRDAMYERMMREARAAASLSHPAIVQVYDVVTDGGRPWVVMELLDARSLSDMVLEDGPLAPRAVAKIGIAMLGALEVAHAAGVLHRDVKPANVLICTDGRAVLTDFGVARMPTDQQLTTPGMVLGSPHFISPERAMGAPFGPPSDLFSLGVTLYAAVEGRPPFDKGEPIATMHAVVEDPPVPPVRAGALTEVLYGLLEKDPDRRWDATRARQALRDLLAGPLASRTPMFPTDPYAVVQPAPAPVPPAVHNGGERIGGRALLAPGELPTDRLAHSAETERFAQPAATEQFAQPAAATEQFTQPAAATEQFTQPATDRWAQSIGPAGYPPQPQFESDTVVTPAVNGAGHAAHRAAPSGGLSQAGARLAEAGSWALTALRRLPTGVQVGAAVALTLVVLVGIVVALGNRGSTPESNAAAPPTQTPTADPAGPPFEVQTYQGRGMEINLPAGWEGTDDPNLVYVDFVDPNDQNVAVRLLSEQWSADAQRLVEVAEQNIQNNSGCPAYQRIGITEIEVAGQTGAQLEYLCGEGDQLRRAKWITVVDGSRQYSFRFTAPEQEWADRQAIFDELLRSFRVTG
ncbi:MAG TPA: serine/threonine-protein kinase [Natronosporangium sp.]